MKQYEDSVCKQLSLEYRLKFEDANFACGLTPRKILLDRTRNIHSYFVVCKCSGKRLHSAYWNPDDFHKAIKSMLALQFSDLDRPLFFLFHVGDNLMAVEGNAVRTALLENPEMSVYDYMINNSDRFSEVVPKIHNEL